MPPNGSIVAGPYGSMFPSASILYRPPPEQIEELLALVLRELPVRARRIEWQGLISTIPQVLVEARPSFVLQPEETEFVAEDIAGMEATLAVALTESEFAHVHILPGIVDVFGSDDPPVTVAEGAVLVEAQTSINVRNPKVESLIFRVADALGGWLVDHVTPGVRGPTERVWRNVPTPTGSEAG